MATTTYKPAQILSLKEAIAFFYAWLNETGLSEYMKTDPYTFLSENRRTRTSNKATFGVLPFIRQGDGKVQYRFFQLKHFLDTRLKPALEKKKSVAL